MSINIIDHLKVVRDEAEKVAGQWNGDDSGLMEDKAHCAIEIVDTCDKLIVLINELNNY